MDKFIVVLEYSLIINIIILILWLLMLVFAKDFIHKTHNKFIKISQEDFNKYHYLLIGVYKIIILVFILVPYLTLQFI